jgi:hypothetical protein
MPNNTNERMPNQTGQPDKDKGQNFGQKTQQNAQNTGQRGQQSGTQNPPGKEHEKSSSYSSGSKS